VRGVLAGTREASVNGAVEEGDSEEREGRGEGRV